MAARINRGKKYIINATINDIKDLVSDEINILDKVISMNNIIDFVKKEIVLSIATVLAVVSMFFVVPGKEYIDYIDFRTLGILFCLMAVMEGLKGIGVFEWLAQKLISKVGNKWQLVVILTMLCFFSNMLTPIGNPQNLYLYGKAEMGIVEFVMLMLPFTALAFVILLIWSVKVCGGITTVRIYR